MSKNVVRERENENSVLASGLFARFLLFSCFLFKFCFSIIPFVHLFQFP